jgi:SAM-dependent methyltransferase
MLASHAAACMQLIRDDIERVASDRDMYEEMLSLDGKLLVELGCGAAANTRALAGAGHGRRVLAYEVDRIQHELNLAAAPLANVSFRYGGAEAIDCADASVDGVMMFKSLHHVPLAVMPRALREIHRILKPGGFLYVTEPLFAGDFNHILRLFHDEQGVRAAAFAALVAAVEDGLFELGAEAFYLAPSSFRDFADFEQRIIGATHTAHRLTPEVHAAVRERFAAHCGEDGARFRNPMRADVLVKPGAPAAGA